MTQKFLLLHQISSGGIVGPGAERIFFWNVPVAGVGLPALIASR
jgi:hypothetical protein